MLSERFLRLYNEELRYLRECGLQFAERHPQVAGHLGMHKEGALDPFVERLLEGTAFLSARVHERIDNEYPEFALQMLSRLAPNWYTPMPSIATVALDPDFTSPLWQSPVVLPGGSRVSLSDGSLKNKNTTFVTGRRLEIQPVTIEQAECRASLSAALPDGVARHLRKSHACLRLRLTTHGVKALRDVHFDPLHLTFTGDATGANQLLSVLLNHCDHVVLWANHQPLPLVNVIDRQKLRPGGMGDEEALLPTGIDELPGSRLMREFFAAPSRFYSVELHGVNDFFASCTDQHSFEIIFALNTAPPQLLGQVSASDFHLYATPAINLYPRRCDPITLESHRTEHPVVVDRLNPTLYEIHHLRSVQGVTCDGQTVKFSSLPEESRFEQSQPSAGYALRRCNSPTGRGKTNSAFGDDNLFITLSSGMTEMAQESLASLSVFAMVSDRFFYPEQLQKPELQLEQVLPVTAVRLLRMPSTPRPVPERYLAWRAIELVAVNPLRYTRPGTRDASELLRHWLSLYAWPGDISHRRRITSLVEVSFVPCFERHPGPGPIVWNRGIKASINLSAESHADHGVFLFGHLLHRALSDYCQLNQTLRTELSIDGQPVVEWGPSSER